jgi:sec-independent protein translocase protein TatA
MATPPAIFAAFGIGGTELLIILALALLLFGGTKLPSLARGLGQSIKEFKKASKDDPEDAKSGEAKKPADPTKTPPGSN